MKDQQGPSSSPSTSDRPTAPATKPRLLSGIASSSSFSPSSSSSKSIKPKLYHPSVFRYTCNGRLQLDSRNGGKSKFSAGACRGVQSQLEHLDQWQLTTRDEAIQIFQAKSNAEYGGLPDGSNSGDTRHSKPPTAALPPTTTTSGSSSTAHAMSAVYLSNVLVYPSSEDDDENDKNSKNNNNNNSKNRKNSRPPVTSIVSPQQEEWSCIGSTEVDLLVLRPENSKKNNDKDQIAAVAPFCAPGMTTRDVTTPTLGKERTRTIRLGILEIVYSTAMVDDDEEDEEVNNSNNSTQKQSQSNNKHNPTTLTRRNREKGKKDNNDEDSSKTLSTPQRVYQSSKNVLKHMQLNGHMLYQAMQDEFPTRTYEAGKRISIELEKTVERTFTMMKKVASFMLDDDSDNGENNGNGKPPRRK